MIEHPEPAKLLIWAADERSALHLLMFPEQELWRVSIEGDHDPRGERRGKLFGVLIRSKQ